MNTAPRIVEPDTNQDLFVVMEFEWNQVTVFARDADGDVLNFEWIAPPGAVIETSDGGDGTLQYSTLLLQRDPLLNGRRLTLAIDDGEVSEFVNWTISLPGSK